jgi:hypothetical protein
MTMRTTTRKRTTMTVAVLALATALAAMALAAMADELQIEFTAVEGLTDAAIAGTDKPLKVGTTTHSQYGAIELWCKGPAAGGRYNCAVRKAGTKESPTRLEAVSIAAPYIPGGSVVSLMGANGTGASSNQ